MDTFFLFILFYFFFQIKFYQSEKYLNFIPLKQNTLLNNQMLQTFVGQSKQILNELAYFLACGYRPKAHHYSDKYVQYTAQATIVPTYLKICDYNERCMLTFLLAVSSVIDTLLLRAYVWVKNYIVPITRFTFDDSTLYVRG